MTIERIDSDSRMSQIVIHGDTIYLSGQVGTPGADITTQTQTALAEVEALLEQAGSDKNHLLSAMIWLADIADFDAMNRVWDAWVADGAAPTRATGEARLASPDYKFEVVIVAAKRR